MATLTFAALLRVAVRELHERLEPHTQTHTTQARGISDSRCAVTVVPPGPPPPQSTDIASLPTVITLSALVGAMLVIVFEVVLMIIIVRCRRRERYHQALAGLDMGLYDFHLGGSFTCSLWRAPIELTCPLLRRMSDILLDKNITRISQSDVGIIKRIGIV